MFNLRVLPFHTPAQLRAEASKLGIRSAEMSEHVAKGIVRALRLEQVPSALAQFIFQELTFEGGDVILSSANDVASQSEVLLIGTLYQLQHLSVRLRTLAQADLDLLADEIEKALAHFDAGAGGTLAVRSTRFEWGSRTYVMGIVNVTPDSFSGDGVLARSEDEYVELAAARAERLVAEGADILDFGGESTRPGSQPTSTEEEFRRVIPVIARVRGRVDTPISIDTFKGEVAREALDAGADIVNDVWGLRMDPEMKRVVATRGVPIVIMHNRSKPKDAAQSERLGGRYVGVEYADLVGDIIRELRDQVDTALEAGISADRIILDPGIGFGKTVEQNRELLNRTDELRVLGFPLLLGPSRKGFIGYTLDLPVEERVEGTAAAVAIGILRGADIIRVHDVKEMARVAKMTDAVVR